MKLITTLGTVYTVDLKAKTCHSDFTGSFAFDTVIGAYAGSPCAEFRDVTGHVVLSTGLIESAEDVPADNVSGESGNVFFRTENSAYEVDQEQRLFRRLAGTNNPTNPLYPDGEWQSYDRIELEIDRRAMIYYEPGFGKVKRTSTVREIRGTLVGPPARDVIALEVFVPDAPAV